MVGMIICVAIAFALPWYQQFYRHPYSAAANVTETVDYRWTKTVTTRNIQAFDGDNIVITDVTYSDAGNDNIKQVFNISLAFLILALIGATGVAVLQVVGLITQRRRFRFFAFNLTMASAVMLTIAFLQFLAIRRSFLQDKLCTSDVEIDSPCTMFAGTSHYGLPPSTQEWHPTSGWFVCIGGLICAWSSAIATYIS
ncbi:hypothetical protein SAMD00019534_006590 [Acytostelium subglobosum LB1]|uniref:hypothetical protein n=1 Tax=Acytostelium subglobosum LB1 TaxID=1410327 RepID=UPI000644E586|nr:hypothetical protein SAMD00019534_006590 [Acytostelium subglobosum LB1]GAM17484.1 hypothetical protein SAMD00019534_006590 [Acytostelium subglobosum LB1]|eukprot:XP_012759546.1 hypothetical protein SAMD00019534_006590 [Acytostelium subglobosum LB1]